MRTRCCPQHLGIIVVDTVSSQQHRVHISGQGSAQNSAHITGISKIIENEEHGTVCWKTLRIYAGGTEYVKREHAHHTLRRLCIAQHIHHPFAHLYQLVIGQARTVHQPLKKHSSLYRALQ